MSRAQQIRGFLASQTLTSHIQIAGDLKQRKLAGDLMPELGTLGVRCEEVRSGIRLTGGELPRTVLIAFGHQP